MRRFTNDYNPDGREKRRQARKVSMKGRIRYKGMWVTPNWYRRFVTPYVIPRQCPRKHSPVLVNLYLPAVQEIGEQAEIWQVDLASLSSRRKMQAVAEAYALPPARDMTTFFFHGLVELAAEAHKQAARPAPP